MSTGIFRDINLVCFTIAHPDLRLPQVVIACNYVFIAHALYGTARESSERTVN